MKKTLLSLSLILAMFAGNAQLITYEPFNYNVGDTLPSPLWTGVNTGDQIFVTNGNLSYVGFANPVGNKVSFNGIGRDYQSSFTSNTTGTVYMSLLMQVTDATSLNSTIGGYFSGFAASTTTFGGAIWTRRAANGYNIGLTARTSNAAIVWDATDNLMNNPVLVVVSYELVSGTANDVVKLWLNPSSTDFGAATEPTPTLTTTNTGTDLTAIDRIFIRQDSNTETPFLDIDEIRVGNSWASVTPATTGINEISNNNTIIVFPNPAINLVTISSKELISHVNIYDFQGRIVQEYDFNETTDIKLNISDISNGIYSIVANSTNGKSFSTKLIK